MSKIFVLITYDVNTENAEGKKRLRRITKQCLNYGQRVQNSVFECVIGPAKFKEVQHKLIEIINKEKDSLRFYYLGKNYKNKVEHIGVKPSYDIESTIIV